MQAHPTPWQRLVPEALHALPEGAGVYEVATLVRSVRYIGVAGGNVRVQLAPLAESRTKLPPSPGGYYFRYVPADHENDALNARLGAYRESHRGLPPPGNLEEGPRLRVARRRAA